jgi:quinol monooxygenase YgiN
MSGPLDVVATLEARPGRGAALAAIVTEAIAAVRAETGCLRYDFFRIRRKPDSFIMIERWASGDDLKAHGASAHFAAMSERLSAELAAAPVVQVLDAVE